MKFENVKIGDVVAVSHHTGVSTGGFRQLVRYKKVFFTMLTVDRVIKTQFCCGDLKFHKDCGVAVTNFGHGCAYIPGSTDRPVHKEVQIPTECQLSALNVRLKLIDFVKKYICSSRQFDLTNCESFEDAVKAAELIKDVVELAPPVKRKGE